MLGSLYLNRRMWGKALQHLNLVKKVETSDEAYTLYHGRAYAYYRLGQLDQARMLTKAAKKHASDPVKIDGLAKLEAAIEFQQREPEAAKLSHRQAAEAMTAAPDGPPVLQRRPPEKPRGLIDRSEPPPIEQAAYAGKLIRVECEGAAPALLINGSEGVRSFVIDQLDNVVILGQVGEAEFTCGPQDDAAVRVEYEDPTAETHGDGLVRLIEFLAGG